MVSECQANKIVLLSDGQPFKNEAVSKTESLIGASCAPTGTSDSEIGRKCGYELAEWIYQTDHQPSWTEPSNVSISTIGFNINSSFLNDVASLGGGNYYEADSSDELIEVFTDILTNVIDTSSTFEAPAISINQFNRMSHSNDLYFAMFKPEISSGWSGNLKRYQTIFDGNNMIVSDVNGDNAIDSGTGLFLDSSASFWSNGNDGGDVRLGGAASRLESDNRNVLTHIAGSTGTIDRGGEILSDRFVSSNTSLAGYFPGMTESERESLIDWARGKDVNDEIVGSDERNHMGDILHSSPVIVNYASDSLIFVGTNDGFLHGIIKSTGQELFSFIPEELIGNLSDIYMSLSIGSGWRAHPLDMDVQDSFFMIRDNSPLSKPEGYGKLSGNVWDPIKVSDLSDVTRSVSEDDEVDSEGWMLKLTTDGEKNLSRATTINNQVIFTTYAPSQVTDPCQPALGQGYVYALDVATGDPALALSGSSTGSGSVEDRKKVLKTQVIPPAASALLIDTGNGIQGSIMVGAENVLSDLPFSELTKRTYWQDRLRGNRTINQ